jgi:GNAT superfamily N-acetyltransferase
MRHPRIRRMIILARGAAAAQDGGPVLRALTPLRPPMPTGALPPFRISTDAGEMDVDAIHAFLGGESYWARGIPRETVARSIANSLCFGVFDARDGTQVAFARVVTDRATFAYLADVYVLELYRGRGISRWMMEVITAHPDLQGLRRWMLMTGDAHGLYARFGFRPLAHPDRAMERTRPDVYLRPPPV